MLPSIPLPLALLTLQALPHAFSAPSWNPTAYFSSDWSDGGTGSGTGSGTGNDYTSSDYNPTTHVVVVGGDAGLVYTPPVTYAKVGDLILFEFRQKNHTVVRSEFGTPCSPTTTAPFDSGFEPTSANVTNFPAFVVTVTDDKPIWFYCKQATHCPQGMVGAINPPATGNTFDAFKQKALALNGTWSSNSDSTTKEKVEGKVNENVETGSKSASTNSMIWPQGVNSMAIATTSSWAPAGTKVPTFTGRTHIIIVGGTNGLVYTPPTIQADPGDGVAFLFEMKNHTATQSSFDDPCRPLAGGFNSGFNPVSANATDFPAFVIPVVDPKPIWFHCEQTGHCPQGMVGAINPPPDGNTFDKFRSKALASNTAPTTPAATSTWMPTSTSVPPFTGQTHVIMVGGDAGLVYTPPSIFADPGDLVLFRFGTKNHTVTQSSFDQPCIPLKGGFNSGFKPVMNNSIDLPGFIIPVPDNKPIWFHCEQATHCPQGMVGAINAPSDGNTFDKFKSKALASSASTTSSGKTAMTSPSTSSGPSVRCDISGAKIDIPSGQSELNLPSGVVPKLVTIGRGTQNYTCSNGKFSINTALAELFDISCFVEDDGFFEIIEDIALLLPNPLEKSGYGSKDDAYKKWGNDDVDLVAEIITLGGKADLGLHSFINISHTQLAPKFDFSIVLGEGEFIIANKTGNIPSPDDATNSVAWLELANLSGDLATIMYRMDTAGGQPPTSCDYNGQTHQVEYAAKYWFFEKK